MTNGARELIFVEHPDDLETETAQDALTKSLGDALVAMINDARRLADKAPLVKE